MGGARPPNAVRIIGGQWKRTPLKVPDIAGLRPTPDRVRETLFNWLGQDLTGLTCLDLFAGTGALGLEAASRGADQVVLVERDRTAAQAIRACLTRLAASTVTLLEQDAVAAIRALARQGRRFDVIFLDPPFGQGWVERLLPMLDAVTAPSARLYVESETAWPAVAGVGLTPAWVLLKADKAGLVHYHLLLNEGDTPHG